MLTEFEPYVPMRSLKYKCLSVLASMMRREETEDSLSSTSSSITDEYPITNLNLPMDVVQLIIDHIALNDLPIRPQALCALLSNGGCFSLHGSVLSANNVAENKIILDILSKNCSNLRSLSLNWCDISCKEIPSIKLQCLSCNIESLDDLLIIFSSFPDLIELHINAWLFMDIQQMNNFYQELVRPIYSRNRNTIRKLRLCFSPGNGLFENKLVSYFPNLIQLDCHLNEAIYNAIHRALYTGYMEDILEDGLMVHAYELESLYNIFSKLQALIGSNGFCDFSALTPNLHKLDLFCGNSDGNHLEKLCFLNNLSLFYYFESMELVLKQIGHNLECLELDAMEIVIDVSTIARYCPNLKRFVLGSIEELCFSNELLERPFLHLRTFQLQRPSILEIDDERDFRLEPHVDLLCYILKYAINIEHLEIRVSQISDDDLTKVFENIKSNNPMTNLRVLIIEEIDFLCMSEQCFSQIIRPFDKLCYAQFINR